jgi:hypothetical protein
VFAIFASHNAQLEHVWAAMVSQIRDQVSARREDVDGAGPSFLPACLPACLPGCLPVADVFAPHPRIRKSSMLWAFSILLNNANLNATSTKFERRILFYRMNTTLYLVYMM